MTIEDAVRAYVEPRCAFCGRLLELCPAALRASREDQDGGNERGGDHDRRDDGGEDDD